MGNSIFFAYLFGGMGLFSTALVPVVFVRERRLRREGVTTTGTVVAIKEDNDSGYDAEIEFIASGTRQRFLAGTSFDGLRIGQTVRVRYLPHAPDEACIDEGGRLWAGTFLIVALAAAFSLVGLLMAIFHHVLGDH